MNAVHYYIDKYIDKSNGVPFMVSTLVTCRKSATKVVICNGALNSIHACLPPQTLYLLAYQTPPHPP